MSDPFSRPSDADFLQAINATKFPNLAGAVPAGYEFLYSSAADPNFAAHGLYAVAYLNRGTGQIITAFDGPVTVSNTATAFFGGEKVDPVLAAAATRLNERIAANDASVTEESDIQVATFNERVSAAAAAVPSGPAGGYAFTKDNVFVTGNSGGALFAELSSRANGFGGATYGGVPIPGTESNTAPDNSGLYNYYRSLDFIGNSGSDRAVKPQPGTGTAFHFGKDVEIGDIPGADALVADDVNIARYP